MKKEAEKFVEDFNELMDEVFYNFVGATGLMTMGQNELTILINTLHLANSMNELILKEAETLDVIQKQNEEILKKLNGLSR